jgi:hypothetical protein
VIKAELKYPEIRQNPGCRCLLAILSNMANAMAVYPQQKDQGSFKPWSLLIKRGIIG